MNDSPELVLDGRAPLGQQIEEQVRRFVLGGALLPGEELPTVRALAVALSLSPRVVEGAYDRLERAGLVSRADVGAPVVTAPPGDPADADLKQLCEAFWRQAAERGHAPAAVLQALRACLTGEIRHEQAH